MPRPAADLPLVYSCSGCSSAAQMANHIAVQLDRRGEAEMSCIAGVGGDVPHLVRIARSGRPILALDGCPLQCVKHSLAQRGVTPDRQLLLHGGALFVTNLFLQDVRTGRDAFVTDMGCLRREHFFDFTLFSSAE